jgi:hypothetical protein
LACSPLPQCGLYHGNFFPVFPPEKRATNINNLAETKAHPGRAFSFLATQTLPVQPGGFY